MKLEQAIRLLDPDTTVEAIAEIERYAGFSGKKGVMRAIEDACVIACDAMRHQVPHKLIKETDVSFHKCPRCYCLLMGDENYCYNCGQCIKRGE